MQQQQQPGMPAPTHAPQTSHQQRGALAPQGPGGAKSKMSTFEDASPEIKTLARQLNR